MVKNPPTMQKTPETLVPSLGWEDLLEEGIAAHSSIAFQCPLAESLWGTGCNSQCNKGGGSVYSWVPFFVPGESPAWYCFLERGLLLLDSCPHPSDSH